MIVKRLALCLLVPGVLCFLSGCHHLSTAQSTVSGKTPVDPWVLTVTNSSDPTPALLWNGLIGFRIGRDGGSMNQPYFSIDEFETTGEEKIKALESPLPQGFLVDGQALPITSDYRQTLDMRTAELVTHWKSDDKTVECSTVLHPSARVIVERWTLKGVQQDSDVDFVLNPKTKLGKATLMSTMFTDHKTGIKGRTLIKQIRKPDLVVECTFTFARSPNFRAMQAARLPGNFPTDPIASYQIPGTESFDEVAQKAKQIWKNRWKTDIEIDGPVEDQQVVHSWLFYLQSSIAPSAGMAESPFSVSNQMYNGHVFWDADMWVFPALALINPDIARSIPNYRLATFEMARKNAAGDKRIAGHVAPSACKFAWESSVSGQETDTGPSKDELHITGDVAWALNTAAELGLVNESAAKTVIKASDDYFKAISSTKSASQTLELKNVMSPDENYTGDNDLYTNLLAQWVSNGGNWNRKAGGASYHLPKDATSLLTYDGDRLKAYKQAAAVLSIYPLQYPDAERQAKVMIERFAPKVSKNGPAMSDSVHSIIWARLGDREKAYRAWRESWIPFTKQPLLLFSEKRTKATTYFTTGAGGSLQSVLFGFLGFRLDSTQAKGATWSKKLNGDGWLSIKPNLPKEWKSVKMKNFRLLGRPYTLIATHRPAGPDTAEVIQGD